MESRKVPEGTSEMTHLMMSSISTACNAMVAPNQTIGGSDAFGEIDIRAVDGTSSGEDLGAMRSALSWQLQDPELHVSGSISVHGVCAADVSRESAGHRSMFALADREALPHGYSRPGVAQHAGQCERHARLADLCRLRAAPDRHRTQAVHQRTLWGRSGQHGVRLGLHHHRLVALAVSVGAISNHQGGREAAPAARFARQYPGFYSYQRWQAARRQHPRPVDSRSRIVLRHGSRLHRLPTVVSVASGRELLRHPREAPQ